MAAWKLLSEERQRWHGDGVFGKKLLEGRNREGIAPVRVRD